MSALELPDSVLVAEGFAISDGPTHISAHNEPHQSTSSLPSIRGAGGFTAGVKYKGIARRTLGILLLLATVFLWTGSSFLASSILADNSYSKPYFVTYINTSFFAISLLPISLGAVYRCGYHKIKTSISDYWHGRLLKNCKTEFSEEEENLCQQTSLGAHLSVDDGIEDSPLQESRSYGNSETDGELNIRDLSLLSLEFCLLWFIANYFVTACLTFTSVASSTILTSTSSVWTLVLGALLQVESFSFRKLIGVLASLAGIILISSIDLSGNNDENRGSFPHKSQRQIAVGDVMALFSALMYGIYTVVMKKRIGNEKRVNMPLFFGLVGLFNVIFLWPGFLILHLTRVEIFEMPPTNRVWAIILVNAAFSLISDYCWAYAMLLTTPLVVTVGLSLTIPLSLIGQIVLKAQYSTVLYWAGAFIVLVSFLFVNSESHEEDQSSP